MNTRNLVFIWFGFLICVVMGGCGTKEKETGELCHIVLEEGEGFCAEEPVQTAETGSDMSFKIILEDGYYSSGSDYQGKYEITLSDKSDTETVILTLHDVKYSESICFLAEKGKYEICYDANGGKGRDGGPDFVKQYDKGAHLRINTLRGIDIFCREGFTLVGWNTEADGTGTQVGLGSRIQWKKDLVLYAQWIPWTDISRFTYEIKENYAVITGYSGNEEKICIPSEAEGVPVRTVAEKSFYETDCKSVILSPGIYEIEKKAFQNSSLEELWFSDDLARISGYAFEGCEKLKTIHINAVQLPAYSGNYFDTFQDKYDRLQFLKDTRKIVLFSGSSTRFGYDSEEIKKAFPRYEVVNMGVFAYSPALPQLELILECMKDGDILLDSPEFDAANRQFCSQKELDYAVFAMMESNYDTFARLDIRNYSQVFNAYTSYQETRKDMERKNYQLSAADFDEDGNPVTEKSYNEYGDYVLYRPNSGKEDPIYGLPVHYTVNAFPKETYLDPANQEFKKFLDKGIRVYFTYSPRNKYAVSKESTEKERARLHQYLKKNLIVPVISEIEDSLYSGIYLYGTDNHLSTEGVRIRTEKVIMDIKKQLEQEEKR